VPAWRPLAGLIRSLSARGGRDPSQFCRARFSPPDRHRSVSPQPGLEVCWMLADQLDYVVGVDTHALAIVDVRTGGIVLETSVAASLHRRACRGNGCGFESFARREERRPRGNPRAG
jgi:hypothetical protein